MRRNENNLANFEVVYTFQRKVSVKNERTVGSQGASHVPTNCPLQKFLDQLDMSHTPAQQPKTLPFPREEIATLLRSTTQQGGHTAPTNPLQEALTDTTDQNRRHTTSLSRTRRPPVIIVPVFLIVGFLSSTNEWVLIKLTVISHSVLIYYGLS